MLIKKGGISREIDEKDLQTYRSKGYKPVEDNPTAEPGEEKSLERMNKAELEVKAVELGLRVSKEVTKKELIEMILTSQEKKGE